MKPASEPVKRMLPRGLSDFAAGDVAGVTLVVPADGKDGLDAVLARTLAQRPRLVLLVEPTANLDAGTEAALAEAIHALRGTHTVVVVAHRPAAEIDVVEHRAGEVHA